MLGSASELGTLRCCGGCRWGFGNVLPGGNNFGRNAQYGSLLSLSYLIFGGGGASHQLINDFREIIPNPCPAGGNQNQQ